jgi:hypothetical protein
MQVTRPVARVRWSSPTIFRRAWVASTTTSRNCCGDCLGVMLPVYASTWPGGRGKGGSVSDGPSEGFSNLHPLGRSGLFHYGWLHTVVRMAHDLMVQLAVDDGNVSLAAPASIAGPLSAAADRLSAPSGSS